MALKAFAEFQKLEPKNKSKLVIAGGCEGKNKENQEHYKELNDLAKKLKIEKDTYFRKNVSDEERAMLLKNNIAVLYTPENEHFGIVPVEAMYNKRPVIACNSGGPKESIVDNKTGFLLESDNMK